MKEVNANGTETGDKLKIKLTIFSQESGAKTYHSAGAKIPDNNWETEIPHFADESFEKAKSLKALMILCVRTIGNPGDAHALYAKRYNPTGKMFHCLNSWGGIKPEPLVHVSRVYAIHYVQIETLMNTD